LINNSILEFKQKSIHTRSKLWI